MKNEYWSSNEPAKERNKITHFKAETILSSAKFENDNNQKMSIFENRNIPGNIFFDKTMKHRIIINEVNQILDDAIQKINFDGKEKVEYSVSEDSEDSNESSVRSLHIPKLSIKDVNKTKQKKNSLPILALDDSEPEYDSDNNNHSFDANASNEDNSQISSSDELPPRKQDSYHENKHKDGYHKNTLNKTFDNNSTISDSTSTESSDNSIMETSEKDTDKVDDLIDTKHINNSKGQPRSDYMKNHIQDNIRNESIPNKNQSPKKNFPPFQMSYYTPNQVQTKPPPPTIEHPSTSPINIIGYRFNEKNLIEYQIKAQIAGKPEPIVSFLNPNDINDLNLISSFWIKKSGVDKEPRKDIQPMKESFIPHKIQENVDVHDSETVEILGITECEPILKIAVRSQDGIISVLPTSEAKRLFPSQLSLFYEKFIQFTD